jgi:hypothetical protein
MSRSKLTFISRVTNRIEKGWPAQSTCDRASFVREGVLMMCQRSLVAFIVRSLLLVCFYFLLQLPSKYQVRIDPDLFLQSITMKIAGRRVNTGPWEFAPGHRLSNRGEWVEGVECTDEEMIDQDKVRSDAWARWDAWAALVATHMPGVGRHGPLVHRIPMPKPKTTAKPGVPRFRCEIQRLRAYFLFSAAGRRLRRRRRGSSNIAATREG